MGFVTFEFRKGTHLCPGVEFMGDRSYFLSGIRLESSFLVGVFSPIYVAIRSFQVECINLNVLAGCSARVSPEIFVLPFGC